MRVLAVALTAMLAVVPPLPAQEQTIAPNTEFRVKLLGPLSTETNRKGDKITAQVLSPQEFVGDIVEGQVRESKSGGKVKGTSVLNFTFETLTHAEKAIPIESQVVSISNSKGQANVDEEGRVIEKKNNIGKAAAGAAAGAVLGGILGGGKGAAIGAGVGGAAALVLIKVSAKGANVSFAPGSEVVLSVKERR